MTIFDPSDAFSRSALAEICVLPETSFGRVFDLDYYEVTEQAAPDNFYFYKDNGSKILAVAHLDTVGNYDQREARFVDTEGGEVVFSRALDDRLGAYIILDMLPKLGVSVDVLLTVGEESGQSTAAFFDTPAGKDYHWMIEFDRGGTDVVMYQYEDADTKALVEDTGARVGEGIFSDISYLDHLEIKGFNWGVGYRDYHGPRAHAFLEDTFKMVRYFLRFHDVNADEYLPHEDYSPTVSDKDAWWNDPTDPFYTEPDRYGTRRYGGWNSSPSWDDLSVPKRDPWDRRPTMTDDELDTFLDAEEPTDDELSTLDRGDSPVRGSKIA